MATRVPEAGLPGSLNNCVLTLDGDKGYMHFLQPSATVEIQGVVSSFHYHRPPGDVAAIDVLPIGGSLARGYCTVRHELELMGAPTATNKEVRYRVKDTGYLEPCSTAAGKILSPVLVAQAVATLACPRATEPWFRAPNPL
jgi:hypothetical protein